jgi:hypothetical protein
MIRILRIYWKIEDGFVGFSILDYGDGCGG